jgi:hypothetical protein
MNYLTPAQAGAQLLSLFVLAAVARWYVMPWLNRNSRADALIALLWVHVARYIVLQVPSAQGSGFPISNAGAVEIVVGDVTGAFLAFFAIALLRRRAHLGVVLAWLLVIETVYDTIANIRGGVREHLMGADTGSRRTKNAFAQSMESQAVGSRSPCLASPTAHHRPSYRRPSSLSRSKSNRSNRSLIAGPLTGI